MWRVVCTGPGPTLALRRIVDRGPFHPKKAHAERFANLLRATGLYESVELAALNAPFNADVNSPKQAPPARPREPDLDDFSKMLG
jgi:hypothetical protein